MQSDQCSPPKKALNDSHTSRITTYLIMLRLEPKLHSTKQSPTRGNIFKRSKVSQTRFFVFIISMNRFATSINDSFSSFSDKPFSRSLIDFTVLSLQFALLLHRIHFQHLCSFEFVEAFLPIAAYDIRFFPLYCC